MKKHRGEIVEEVVRRSGFSIKNLAERMKLSRNTLYNRFKEPELNYEFIAAVGNIIHYNFAIDFPNLEEEVDQVNEKTIGYMERDTSQLLKLERKYAAILERYNGLLSIMVRLANSNNLEALRKDILNFLNNHLHDHNADQ